MAGARRCLGLTGAILLAGVRLPAQVSLSFSAGVRYTSSLVRDSIVTPLDLQPALAPVVAGIVGFPLNGPWRVEAVVDVGSSELRMHETGGSTTDVTRLTTLGFGVGLRRRFHTWLAGRFAVGGITYLPAGDVGMFRDGTGGLAPFGQVTADLAPAIAARHHLAIELQGDVHRFLTPALKADGFTDSRLVYRIALGIRYDLLRRESPSPAVTGKP